MKIKLDVNEDAKITALEEAVRSDTPNEVSALYKKLGNVLLTAHILGIACRFRGLEMVKVLIENGATFRCDRETVRYRSYELFGYTAYDLDFFLLFLFSEINKIHEHQLRVYLSTLRDREGHLLEPISKEQLMEVIIYLCDNGQNTGFCPGELLCLALFAGEKEIAAALKDRGISISDNKKRMLTEGHGRTVWYIYIDCIRTMNDERFLQVMSEVVHDVGEDKKLHFTNGMEYALQDRFYHPEIFSFFMKHFDHSKMKKKYLLQRLIADENTECLKLAANQGWLKRPQLRDEMIQYASENHKTECTAFLLDYKNRTADFAAEAERAERKMSRELNANPNSMTQLKKTWAFREKEDGTLVITGYKGSSTEITVPEMIGKCRVTEIGPLAFAPYGPRVKESVRAFRRTITKIILPAGIRVIGVSAFRDLPALQEIVLAAGVEVIGEYAFSDCNQLKEVVIPEGVRIVGDGVFSSWHRAGMALQQVVLPSTLDIFKDAQCAENAPALFLNCDNVTVRIPALLPARIYCEKFGLHYEYNGGEQ